jgi:hypothetical protein
MPTAATPIVPDRVTVVQHVYHQSPDDQPFAVTTGFNRYLATKEQAYQRKTKVGTDWESLDTGWLNQASLLLIKNEEGKFTQQTPSEEEREESQRKVIEVACGPNLPANHEPDWLVLPQEEIRVTPADLSRIRIRCQYGIAYFTVTLIPL